MIKYEGQINKFFTRQAVADVVTGLPKLQTPMMDLLFPAGARKQKASPFLSLEEVTGAIGTVPLTARGGSSVSIDGTGKKRSIIEPCELKPSTFIAARDLNDLGIRTKKKSLWNKSSFNKLLSNERYIGYYIYADHRIENGVPAKFIESNTKAFALGYEG